MTFRRMGALAVVAVLGVTLLSAGQVLLGRLPELGEVADLVRVVVELGRAGQAPISLAQRGRVEAGAAAPTPGSPA